MNDLLEGPVRLMHKSCLLKLTYQY